MTSTDSINALVVGPGSVGQVFARHLHIAGANVAFLVRSENERKTGKGLTLYALNKPGARSKPIRFSSFDVLSQDAQLDSRKWDQIYMCVPSNSLSSSLLEWVQNHAGGATIVKFQPGPSDRNSYASYVDDTQLVAGMLSLISYQAPLSGEVVPEPGTAYWFPPLLPCLFSGSESRMREVVETLRRGGLPARAHSDVETLVGHVLAVEAPLTAALECAGWSIDDFKRSQWFDVAYATIVEASDIVSRDRNVSRPAIMSLLRPMTLRLAISLVPKRRPIPLEPYLKQHFGKLHLQSRQHIDDLIDLGSENGMSVTSLKVLREGLG